MAFANATDFCPTTPWFILGKLWCGQDYSWMPSGSLRNRILSPAGRLPLQPWKEVISMSNNIGEDDPMDPGLGFLALIVIWWSTEGAWLILDRLFLGG